MSSSTPLNSTESAPSRAEEIRHLFDRYVAPTYRRSLVLSHGSGSFVWDVDGKRYLDFGGGIAVTALGHAHPRVAQALAQQASRLVHVSNLFHTEPQGLLARKLVELTGPGKVFFANSGAESNEALFKMARRFGQETGGRFEIITALDSFHGRTLGGISATGQDKIKAGFGPLVPGFVHATFNDLDAFARAITPQTVAVMIEGIRGESGIHPATPEFLLGLRRLADQHNLLFLFDAVQCGMFRTGHFQSYETILSEAGIDPVLARPDAISMAKSLGNGLPIGAAWFSSKVADLLGPGSHGTTYGGSPLVCAAALEVLHTIEDENLADNVRRIGRRLRSGLEELRAQGKPIKDVRGCGAMIGMELDRDPLEAAAQLRQAGLILIPSGHNTLRFLPPLNATEDEVALALQLIKDTL
ncbi:MAG: acetylornithine transaminase [Candidatus Methylacidiphilales bacterium]